MHLMNCFCPLCAVTLACILQWSGPTKRILFSIVTTAKYASYSKFDAKIIFLRRSMVAMAIISIALSIYANEIRTSPSFTGVTQTMTLDNLCLAGVTVLTVTMFFCNLSLKYWAGREDYLSAHLQRNHKVQPAWAIFANMVQGGLLSFEHMLELLIVLPHMPPYLALTFSYNTDYYGVPKVNTYRMESLAAMWTLLRLYKPPPLTSTLLLCSQKIPSGTWPSRWCVTRCCRSTPTSASLNKTQRSAFIPSLPPSSS